MPAVGLGQRQRLASHAERIEGQVDVLHLEAPLVLSVFHPPTRLEGPSQHLTKIRAHRGHKQREPFGPDSQLGARVSHVLIDDAQGIGHAVGEDPVLREHKARARRRDS